MDICAKFEGSSLKFSGLWVMDRREVMTSIFSLTPPKLNYFQLLELCSWVKRHVWQGSHLLELHCLGNVNEQNENSQSFRAGRLASCEISGHEATSQSPVDGHRKILPCCHVHGASHVAKCSKSNTWQATDEGFSIRTGGHLIWS